MFNIFLLSFTLSFSSFILANETETLVARLDYNDQTKNYVIKTLDKETIPLIIDQKYFTPLKSLTNDFFEGLRQLDGRHFPEYFLLFKGERINGNFKSKQTPRVMSGTHRIDGILTKTIQAYTIAGKTFSFAESYKTNGTRFNQESINSYIGKKVSVLYKISNSNINLITAIVPGITQQMKIF